MNIQLVSNTAMVKLRTLFYVKNQWTGYFVLSILLEVEFTQAAERQPINAQDAPDIPI